MLCILDDRVVICNGHFSWSEDDTSVLKELVFLELLDCYMYNSSII